MNRDKINKRIFLFIAAVAVAGSAIIVWRSQLQNDQKATGNPRLKQLALSVMQYRDNAPPLLIKTGPDGSKDYYWVVEGQYIHKRRETPKKQ